jgi:hypothetical protein
MHWFNPVNAVQEPVPLMGRSAILGEQRNNYFCDVACGRGEMVSIVYYFVWDIRIYRILLEKPSLTQDHNTRVAENSVTHIYKEAQSLVLTDFSDRSTWMMEFSVTLVFWSCVTLGFFNIVYGHNPLMCLTISVMKVQVTFIQ